MQLRKEVILPKEAAAEPDLAVTVRLYPVIPAVLRGLTCATDFLYRNCVCLCSLCSGMCSLQREQIDSVRLV